MTAGKCVECGATFGTSATCLECGGLVSGSTISIHDLGSAGVFIMEDAYEKMRAERDALRAANNALSDTLYETETRREALTAEVERLRAEVKRGLTAIALEDAVLRWDGNRSMALHRVPQVRAAIADSRDARKERER